MIIVFLAMSFDLIRPLLGVGLLVVWRYRSEMTDKMWRTLSRIRGHAMSRFEPTVCLCNDGDCNAENTTTLFPCAEINMFDAKGNVMHNDAIRIGLLECTVSVDDAAVGQEVNLWWLLRKQWSAHCAKLWFRSPPPFPERIEAHINPTLLTITNAHVPVDQNGDGDSVVVGAHVLNVISPMVKK